MRRSEGEPPYRRLRSESDTIVIASEAWQSRGNEMPPTYPRQPTCPRWLTAEKSPAEETRTSVHVMRRSEGEPPYRRLRSESDTIVIASEGVAAAWQSRGNEMPPTRPRRLRAPRWLTAEKSPAEETRTNVYEYPKHSPARAPRPAVAYRRKKRFARFCRENRFSIYVIAFLRREPLISVSCGYTYSAFTAACFRDRSRFLSFPKPFTSVPATAENRVVFYKTKKTG